MTRRGRSRAVQVMLVLLVTVSLVGSVIPFDPVGYADYTPNVVTSLSDAPDNGVALPAKARHAVICVETNPIRYTSDGTTPTTAKGILVSAGSCIEVTNSRSFLVGFKMLDTSAGASFVAVDYGQ